MWAARSEFGSHPLCCATTSGRIDRVPLHTGRIQLSVSTVNRTYELSGITDMTPFHKYGKHSTGPSTYGLWARTYSKLVSCPFLRFVVTESSRIKSVRTEGCHVGVSREFVGTACWTYGQSNTTSKRSIQIILGRELGPSGVCPNQVSRWNYAFLQLKHV